MSELAIKDIDLRCMGTRTIVRMEKKIIVLHECLNAEKELNRKAQIKLSSYIKAINRIDDYFEYSMDSEKDQKKVRQILKELACSIIYGEG